MMNKENIKKFVESLNKNKKIKKLLKRHQVEKGFNIFEISKKSENFHSDILAQILDPNTSDIGNPKYLELFLKTLKQINKKLNITINPDNVQVKREMATFDEIGSGRIDLCVLDKENKKAIIIENKIKKAEDTYRQIEKYYQFLIKQKYDVQALVYLPPNNKKTPNLQDTNDEIKNIINTKLVILPAPVLADKFLSECIKTAEDISKITHNNLAEIYIKHYSNLLKTIGEDMTNEEILDEIYSDNEMFQNFNTFDRVCRIWADKSSVVKNYLINKLKENLIKNNFIASGHNCLKEDVRCEYLVKKISDKYYILAILDWLTIGVIIKDANDEEIKNIKEKLNSLTKDSLGKPYYFRDKANDDWTGTRENFKLIHRNFFAEKVISNQTTLDVKLKNILDAYVELEEKITEK